MNLEYMINNPKEALAELEKKERELEINLRTTEVTLNKLKEELDSDENSGEYSDILEKIYTAKTKEDLIEISRLIEEVENNIKQEIAKIIESNPNITI